MAARVTAAVVQVLGERGYGNEITLALRAREMRFNFVRNIHGMSCPAIGMP